MTRHPAVAGRFYTDDGILLKKQIEKMLPECAKKINAIGAVVPHAGYMYSGATAGAVYAELEPKATYIILGPNHWGSGARFASSSEDWSTPLGKVSIDIDLLESIVKKTKLVTESQPAHLKEHSLEVQVPFMQVTSPNAKIVPIAIKHGSLDEYLEIASAIAGAVRSSGKDAMIIASSDMTHYESRKAAREKDEMAIKEVLGLDAEGLLGVVEKERISMCGYIPAAIMLIAARELGAKKGKLVRYSDSGEVTGDTEEVVGYAGMILY